MVAKLPIFFPSFSLPFAKSASFEMAATELSDPWARNIPLSLHETLHTLHAQHGLRVCSAISFIVSFLAPESPPPTTRCASYHCGLFVERCRGEVSSDAVAQAVG